MRFLFFMLLASIPIFCNASYSVQIPLSQVTNNTPSDDDTPSDGSDGIDATEFLNTYCAGVRQSSMAYVGSQEAFSATSELPSAFKDAVSYGGKFSSSESFSGSSVVLCTTNHKSTDSTKSEFSAFLDQLKNDSSLIDSITNGPLLFSEMPSVSSEKYVNLSPKTSDFCVNAYDGNTQVTSADGKVSPAKFCEGFDWNLFAQAYKLTVPSDWSQGFPVEGESLSNDCTFDPCPAIPDEPYPADVINGSLNFSRFPGSLDKDGLKNVTKVTGSVNFSNITGEVPTTPFLESLTVVGDPDNSETESFLISTLNSTGNGSFKETAISPSLKTVNGDLAVELGDISDLSALSSVEKVTNVLGISEDNGVSRTLNDFSGLTSLKEVGSLKVSNFNFNSLNGFPSLTNFGSIEFNNQEVHSLSGLSNIESLGNMTSEYEAGTYSTYDLSKISVSGTFSDLSGLESVPGGPLRIDIHSENLSSLDGFGIDSVFSLEISTDQEFDDITGLESIELIPDTPGGSSGFNGTINLIEYASDSGSYSGPKLSGAAICHVDADSLWNGSDIPKNEACNYTYLDTAEMDWGWVDPNDSDFWWNGNTTATFGVLSDSVSTEVPTVQELIDDQLKWANYTEKSPTYYVAETNEQRLELKADPFTSMSFCNGFDASGNSEFTSFDLNSSVTKHDLHWVCQKSYERDETVEPYPFMP